MKMTRLIAVLVGLAAVALFAADASAMYHPTMGRFMQRDPGPSAGSPTRIGAAGPAVGGGFIPRDQYADGMNLYQYVQSSPSSRLDPYGLWTIIRDSQPKAAAVAEKNDTIKKLATAIGLDPVEYKQWLTILAYDVSFMGTMARPGHMPGSPDEVLCEGEAYEVPNSILAYWGAFGGGLGRFWVMWGTDLKGLRARGFFVDEREGWTEPFWQFLPYLRRETEARNLHGILFWGHGGFSLYTDQWGTAGTGAIPAALIAKELKYRLGLGILWGCEMMDSYGDPSKGVFSKNAIVRGGGALLGPWPFHLYGPTVGQIVEPGAQGTKD